MQFEGEKFFDIYDIQTGELSLRQTFAVFIKFVTCTVRCDRVVQMKSVEDAELNLLVVLEKGELHKFKVKNEEKINLLFDYKIPPSGIECHDLSYSNNEESLLFYNFNYYVLTYEDGSFCCYDDADFEDEAQVEAIYFKPNPQLKTAVDPLKIQSINEFGILFITDNGAIYFMKKNDGQIRVIPGKFEIASISSGAFLSASSNGIVSCYYLPQVVFSDTHKTLEYLSFEAHYDDLVYLENLGNHD